MSRLSRISDVRFDLSSISPIKYAVNLNLSVLGEGAAITSSPIFCDTSARSHAVSTRDIERALLNL